MTAKIERVNALSGEVQKRREKSAREAAALVLSNVDQFVMTSILRQNGAAYGVSIREDIEERTKRSVSFSVIYTALQRLEDNGLIESRIGEPTAERGGRRKTHFKITGLGSKVLNASLSDLGAMVRGTKLSEVLS